MISGGSAWGGSWGERPGTFFDYLDFQAWWKTWVRGGRPAPCMECVVYEGSERDPR